MAANRSCWLGSVLFVALACTGGVGAAADKETDVKELEPAWSLEGEWTGIVGDEREGVGYAINLDGKCVEIDSAGRTRRDFTLPMAGKYLRLANWPGEKGRALLAFSRWGRELRAYNLEGEQLWSYVAGDAGRAAIDDVWPANLHGDKSGDVVVGYNGRDGVHVLDTKGQLRWKSTEIANVWHVSAGDALGDGKLQVVTTAAGNKVHIFASDGTKHKEIDAGCGVGVVRVGKLSEKDETATIFVAGMAFGADGKQILNFANALSGDGTNKWRLQLQSGALPGVDSAMLAPVKPWLAIGMPGGRVDVIDAESGRLIASVSDEGEYPEVGWVLSKAAGKPLLVVATGGKLNAFHVPQTK